MKPVREQVVMLTGATDGLGRTLAIELARQGATLLLHGRSDERGQAVIDEIRRRTPTASLQFYRADFSRLSDVRAMADRVAQDHDRLDVLVNNAGVYIDERHVSHDGIELAFQVNYLSHVLLTRVLLPLLKNAAPARIVNVASAGQSPLDFDNLMLERSYDGGVSYRRSKLAQIMFTIDLAQELSKSGVTVNALHPATYMPTKMVNGRFPPANSIEEGAAATLRLMLSEKVEGLTGKYFYMQREDRALTQAYDGKARERLRKATVEMIPGLP